MENSLMEGESFNGEVIFDFLSSKESLTTDTGGLGAISVI